jgi:hypothetical protein
MGLSRYNSQSALIGRLDGARLFKPHDGFLAIMFDSNGARPSD